MLLAAEPTLASGLLLQSYPLHPPGRPADLRTAHLPQLRVPTLFVHGTTDVFAAPAELESARALIPGPTRVLSINGGHDLGWGKKRSGHDLPATIADTFLDLCERALGGAPLVTTTLAKRHGFAAAIVGLGGHGGAVEARSERGWGAISAPHG